MTTSTLVSIKPTSLLNRLSWILGFAALTGLSSMVKIPLPFTPVPITLQTLVVMLSALTLGRDGVWSQILYLMVGALGSFGFASGLPGVVALVGPTGGYLIGFVGCAFLISKFVQPFWGTLSYTKRVGCLLASSVAVFIPGMIQLSVFTGMSLTSAFWMGVAPFILGDIIKCLVAAKMPSTFKRAH